MSKVLFDKHNFIKINTMRRGPGYYFYCVCFIIITTLLLVLKRDYYDPSQVLWRVLPETKVTTSTSSEAPRMKYILVWTLPTSDPIINLGTGTKSFESKNCPITNCYVSPDRGYFEDITKFDVLVFHAKQLPRSYATWMKDMPKIRAPHQKYVFASMESAAYYPICDRKYNGFYNWTWTYKLDSDEVYGYIAVKNKNGELIAPKKVMHWEKVEAMLPIDDEIKAKLSKKNLAAAWFVSNCGAKSGRLEFANTLKHELVQYNLTLDVYGSCGPKKCPRFMKDCLDMVERDYYFYLSFENSFSEDYVTEKLLNALKHYAIPVVYGGSNYTRFMPDGIYLNARTLGVKALARKMAEIIQDKEKYYDYFRWHNHYSYHDVAEFPESDSYCKLCALINNDELFSETRVYDEIVSWWSPPDACR